MNKIWRFLALTAVLTLLVAACGGAATTQAPAPTEAPAAEPTEAPAAEAPTEVNIAGITITPLEEPWNTSWIQTMERLKEAKPHGLTINLDVTENVAPPDAERVLREYAQTGKYDIIWAHSAYPDAIKVLKDEFPEILWAFSGSGNEGLGGNAYWTDVYVHEPAYLMGIIAGMMTKTDTIGAVAAYPFPNVNAPLNGYIAGAESVNPSIEVKSAYIESWFDPPKAKESAEAQIAAGADFIYAERFGPFEAVVAHPGTYAFGHFVDQNSLAPEVVITSVVARWDPDAEVVLDAWWEHVTNGTPYNAPVERVQFLMKDGGADIAPFHELESVLPEEVMAAVEQARADILSGALVVPLNEEAVTSD
jgi:basic membrane lipoprotein Med (substrate-binding protein (PBP1-ABC) superfamily)